MNANFSEPAALNDEHAEGMDTFEASGDQIEAILSRMPPNDRAHYESLLQKYREGKTAQWQEDKLRNAGLIVVRVSKANEKPETQIQTPETQGENDSDRPTVTIPSRVANMGALAGFLNQYFHGKLCKQVQKNHISQWSRNNREFLGWVMVDGVKTIPPALCCQTENTGFYDPKIALEWFTQWILPQAKWRMKGSEEALTHEEKMQRFAERKAQREEDVAEGRFRSVEVFNLHITALGLAVNRALNESEKALKKTILAELEKAQGSETANAELVEDAISRGVRAAVDGLRESMAKSILETEEPVISTTDGHE